MSTERTFSIKVLGRTLEHLGAQMYKRRDTAIAELVANSWDAGATTVRIDYPVGSAYNRSRSTIVITDDGDGMTADEIQDDYLVVGRNRRTAGADTNPVEGRPTMGRKGIGKLAGFGIAGRMELTTWQNGSSTRLVLDMAELKRDAGQVADVPIKGEVDAAPPAGAGPKGTRLVLSDLKHIESIASETLRESLARRFTRQTRGSMTIIVNTLKVEEPDLSLELRYPAEGEQVEDIGDGRTVSYWYGFTSSPLHSTLLRGFGVSVNGKTAQAPPYFFGVEGTASGQHGTRYLTGDINADFLDAGTDDESDIVSTDSQEIDWEVAEAVKLHEWGDKLTRRILREWATRKGDAVQKKVFESPELKERIKALDENSRAQVAKYLQILAQAETDPERTLELADRIVRAFEYRHFHDVIRDIDDASEHPDRLQELLIHMVEWKVLESRAILEVINGRLLILDKFNKTLVNDVPETAPHVGAENLHDLIARYPWLINPDWQILEEERSVSALLREWHAEQPSDEQDHSRIDFLGLTDGGRVLVIEIKRTGHVVTWDNVRRLEDYTIRIRRSHPGARAVFISGDQYEESLLENWNPVNERLTWADIYRRTHAYYEHYQAVLAGDVSSASFASKEREVKSVRTTIDSGSYREKGLGKEGVGPQDASYPLPPGFPVVPPRTD